MISAKPPVDHSHDGDDSSADKCSDSYTIARANVRGFAVFPKIAIDGIIVGQDARSALRLHW
jgi:hypothetical protein